MAQSRGGLRIPLPHEHGAWAMFIAPLAVGIGAARSVNAATAALALTALGFFLLRFPLSLAVKSRTADARASALRWSAIYAAITSLGGAMLLFSTRSWALVALGALGFATLAIYLWLARQRAEMTIWGEWIGIAGLALGAPAAYLVGRGALDAASAALYVLNVLYFGGTVLYIKFKVREQPRLGLPARSLGARLWAGRVSILYHALAVVLVAVLAVTGWAPAVALIAFILPMCKVVSGVLSKPARLDIRRLGFIEAGFTLAFLFIILWGWQ